MHERLITDIGYPGIYSLSVKRRGFTDKHIKTTLVRKKAGLHGQVHQNHTCPQKGRVSRTSTSKPQLVRKKAGFHGQVAF